jgi:two-component system response regulator AtoC
MRPSDQFSLEDVVVGQSARMRAIFDFMKVISRSDSSIIIQGETGTGKEVIANVLHHSSPRRHQPFVAVSCALFAENLIETELFGHERGAFTGAIKDKPGRFELAHGGTLFLDDIDDVPLPMQVKLLRAIQTRTVERVGGTRSIQVNVRIITGTKRDLRQMVAEGKFREDLYYRLNVLPIVLPPLRDRREDIPALMAGRATFVSWRMRASAWFRPARAARSASGAWRPACSWARQMVRRSRQSRRRRRIPYRSTIGCAKWNPTSLAGR